MQGNPAQALRERRAERMLEAAAAELDELEAEEEARGTEGDALPSRPLSPLIAASGAEEERAALLDQLRVWKARPASPLPLTISAQRWRAAARC